MRIYRMSEGGGDGLTSPVYTFSIERWAAVSHKTSREALAGGGPGQTIDATLDFALQTDVRYNDLLVDGDARYFARGVTDQRNPDARLVPAERIPREQYSALTLEEAADIEDGPIADAYQTSIAES